MIKTALTVALSLALVSQPGVQATIPEQMPEVGSNKDVWAAVDTIWKIRKSKPWDAELTDSEADAVRLGLDANDQSFLQDLTWYSRQLLSASVTGVGNSSPGWNIRGTASLERLAYFDPTTGTIYITVGLQSAIHWTQWAILEADANPVLKPHLARFLGAFSKNNFQRDRITSSSVIRLTEFVTGDPWRPSGAVLATMEKTVRGPVFDGLAFAVVHEGCHRRLGHTANISGAFSVRQEWDADDCALRSLAEHLPSHANPYPVLIVLILLGNDGHAASARTTHPDAACRAANVARRLHHGGRAGRGLDDTVFLLRAIRRVDGADQTTSAEFMSRLLISCQTK